MQRSMLVLRVLWRLFCKYFDLYKWAFTHASKSHVHIHTCTHVYIYVYTHTYIHTYIHTNSGEYKAMWCTGQARFDQVTCAKCLKACPAGSYMDGTCESGNRTSDLECKPVSFIESMCLCVFALAWFAWSVCVGTCMVCLKCVCGHLHGLLEVCVWALAWFAAWWIQHLCVHFWKLYMYAAYERVYL
jgi:hypothetical protein